MPLSDRANSQSQAIQEEPLPSTSNEDEDPLAGKKSLIGCFLSVPLPQWWASNTILTRLIVLLTCCTSGALIVLHGQ